MSHPAAAAAAGAFPTHAHARASPPSTTTSTKFRVRRIPFPPHTLPRPVLLQNANGPCPLLALVNVLLLRGPLNVGPAAEEVSEAALLQGLANRALELEAKREQSKPAAAAGAGAAAAAVRTANKRWHIGELLELLPCLAEGLDVNVRFDGADAFESTAALTAFDALGVRLLHGWLRDPQDGRTARALLAAPDGDGQASSSSTTYNQAVDQLIAYRALLEEYDAVDYPAAVLTSSLALPSPSDDAAARRRRRLLRDGPVIEEWLQSTAGQLTVYGLATLHEQVQEGELAALFRAKHFSVLHKRGGRLFVLATDEGFLHDASGGGEAVWERLDEPTGNVEYVDGWFRPLAPLVEPPQQQPQRRWGLVAAAGGASRRPPPASVSPPSLTSALPPPTATTPAPAPSSVAAAAAAAAAPAAMSAVDATAAVPPFPPPAHRSPGVSDRLLALQLERDQEEAAREGKRAFAAEGVAALLGEGGPLELLRARDPGAVVPLPCASPSPPVGDREVAAAGRMGEDGQGEEVEGGFYLVSAAAAGNGGGGGGGGIGGVGEEAFFVDPETRRPFTGEELAAMRAAEEAFRRAKEARDGSRSQIGHAAVDEVASGEEPERGGVLEQQEEQQERLCGDDRGRRGRHRGGGGHKKACVVQ